MSLDHLNQPEPVQPENNDSEIYSVFEEVEVPVFEESNRKMNPLTLYLVIAAIVAVVLACVILGFTLLSGEETPSENTDTDQSDTTQVTDNAEDNSLVLLDKTDKGKVVLRQIDFKNAEGSFTVYYNEKNGKFLLKGYEDIELSEDLVTVMKGYTTTIVATEQVKTPGALKNYGLDKPEASALITYADGSTVTLHLGKTLPTGDGYYGTLNTKDGVYMFDADSVSLFRFRPAAFADTVLVSSPTVKKDDTYGSAVLKEIQYTGKNYAQPFTMRRSYHTDGEELQLFSYIISAPYLRGATDAAAGYLSSFKALSASHALYLHPTAEQKKKLGFDSPMAKLHITMAVETSKSDAEDAPNIYYNETTAVLTIGSTDSDGNYMAMLEGVDAIFLLEKEAFSSIADRTYENSVNELLFLKNIDQIGRITIEIDGKTTDFQLKHYPNEEKLDDQMQVIAEGKTMSTGDFRELYQLLMGLARMDTLKNVPEGKPVMTVKMYTTEGKFYMGATYHSLSGTLCAVETTEGEVFATRWRNVTHFMEQVENLLNSEKVLIMTY